MHIELKFKRFDDLLNEVLVDLRVVDDEGMIEPAQLVAIAQRVNYDLGLRIHQNKETLIDIEHNVGKLPEDFYTLNFALLTSHHKEVVDNFWAGRTSENIDVPCDEVKDQLLPYETLGNSCTPEQDPFFQRKVYSVCEGNRCVKVVDHRKSELKEYTTFERLYIKPQKYLDPGSLNSRMVDCHTAEIKNGYLYCSAECAKVYLSYQGALEDEEGNLLVLDHPEINEYYKSALIERIFKNLWYAGEEVKQKYDEAKIQTREDRVRALSIVNMPNFSELLSTWRLNRKSQYNRYYDTFRTGVFDSWYHFDSLRS